MRSEQKLTDEDVGGHDQAPHGLRKQAVGQEDEGVDHEEKGAEQLLFPVDALIEFPIEAYDDQILQSDHHILPIHTEWHLLVHAVCTGVQVHEDLKLLK